MDECHRGSAAKDAAWRKVLEYFPSATQIGLTATPKETREVSNIEYFGEPLYTYSLRQGIADEFLAPYKVIRIGLDNDLDGWRPEVRQTSSASRGVSPASRKNTCPTSCASPTSCCTASMFPRVFDMITRWPARCGTGAPGSGWTWS